MILILNFCCMIGMYFILMHDWYVFYCMIGIVIIVIFCCMIGMYSIDSLICKIILIKVMLAMF
jgi:hypothetical protein